VNRPIRMKRITKYLDPRIVAVTGGIGSGQSTVSDYLSGLGCKVIDVDRKARQIIDNDSALQQELKKIFGQDIFDGNGQLKRRLLASLVFGDLEKTKRLNHLVHPRMVAEIVEEMEEARFSRRYPLVVVDAALVFELNMEKMFDAVIVVNAALETRIQRVMQRDGQSREEIMARIQRQIPLEDKVHWASHVIDNNESLEELKKQTLQIFEELTADLPVEKRIRI
jgi:dephospho-CoA kinase